MTTDQGRSVVARFTRALCVLVPVAGFAAAARGQSSGTAAFRGTVTASQSSAPIAGVDVWILGLDKHVRTDSTGSFAFSDLPAVQEVVQFQRVGYTVQRDVIAFAANTTVTRTYRLAAAAPTLPTVRTVAPGTRYMSPQLQAFEERRLSHAGGFFISDSVFRAHENQDLLTFLASRLPGLTRNVQHALVSTRKQCRGPEFIPSQVCSGRHIPDCYVAIYIDGNLLYRAQMMDQGEPPPDFSHYDLTEFAGAECYAGGAASPIGMHSDDDGCGSLWLWTREK